MGEYIQIVRPPFRELAKLEFGGDITKLALINYGGKILATTLK